MSTIFQRFCKDNNAFINPGDVVERITGFPEVCITTFSEVIIRDYIEKNPAEKIADLYSANGPLPVYEIEYGGSRIGLFLSRVGAPACAAGLEEIIAMGAKKIILFGCCGILDQKAAGNKIIIPLSAVRDEGTSYHYISADEEINADSVSIDIAVQCMEKHRVPYVKGKIWTTDAIYRETREAIEERREQGCIAVEMECAASIAVAGFRKITLISFFYGADNLDADIWEPKDLTDYGAQSADKYMTIALECAAAV